MSLRKYLLFSLLLIIAGIGGVTIWSSYQASRHEVQELFDAQLSRSARLLLSMAVADIREGHIRELQDLLLENQLRLEVDGEERTPEEDAHFEGHEYEAKLAFQVWDVHGNMLLRSANAPLLPLTSQQPGYSDSIIEGTEWRIFSLWSHDRQYLVTAAERYDVRMELVNAIAIRLVLPFVILLPILAWLLWMAVGHGLAPLQRIAREVQSRDEHFLDSIDESNAPDEVKPLLHALNRLFDKLADSLEKERRFTSDAAHELRTPLAALKTHAQLALSAPSCEESQHALKQVIKGVDRASHVVDQLLNLAKLEPGSSVLGRDRKQLDLHQLVVDEVAGLAMMAAAKNIELAVNETGAVMIQGDAVSLAMLIRNLIDNAIRYTPQNGTVDVALEVSGQQVVLTVTDSGPGISEADRERLFERFYRGKGLQESGCGIGLSIVKRIAELHHANIELANVSTEGGLQVAVTFAKS